MTSEKNFQNYFMQVAGHCQRIPPDGNPGVPDTEVIRGLTTYRVELKVLKIGPSGDRKLRPVFKKSQPPYYAKFLHSGGEGLYVVFRLEKSYGILRVGMDFVRDIEVVQYRELKERYLYREYKTLKELLDVELS